MKKLFLCGLLVLLLVYVMPVGAYTAVDDQFYIFSAPFGADPFVNIRNVCKNDIPYPGPSGGTVVITEYPKYGSVFVASTGEIIYNSKSPYFGPDPFEYKFCEGQSCSNEATVYLNVLPWKNCASRIWLYTPADTVLTIKIDDVLGCGPFHSLTDDIRPISGPNHGKLTENFTHPLGGLMCAYNLCYDYTPDIGFTGWDLITIIPFWDPGYGANPLLGKLSEMAIYVGNPPYPTPEFPSIFFPATMIIGFLGAVFLIQRTREH